MKVRIAGNSIRFRLKQPEVNHFFKTGSITEKIEFGPQARDQLSFCLEKYSGSQLEICYETNRVVICVPESLAERWVQTELVGLDGQLDTKKNRTVFVLIEKDFACLDGSEQENEGTYPNPLANCQPIENAR